MKHNRSIGLSSIDLGEDNFLVGFHTLPETIISLLFLKK